MQILKLFILLIILIIPNTISAQEVSEIQEDKYWMSDIIGIYCKGSGITYNFNNYSKEDVQKAKSKYQSIKNESQISEWEGLYYYPFTAVGDRKLFWSSNNGYFSFYCYHKMDYIDYGNVLNSSDFIKLSSDKDPAKNVKKSKLIKIKFGDKHFLVYEEYIKSFLEAAAGLNKRELSDSRYSNLFDYWKKEKDIEAEVFGQPIVPEMYKKWIKVPIKTEIIKIGERKTIPSERSNEKYNFDDIHYLVTLNSGKNKDIKVGMDFFVKEMNEWIQITKVLEKSSIGYFRRDFNSDGKEQCWDDRGGSGYLITCKEIKIGMKAVTKTDL